MTAPILGIDLGTTNSCAAILEDGEPTLIPMRDGMSTVPSVVAIEADGSYIVGELARRQAQANPEATVFGVKRLIGRKRKAPELEEWCRRASYEVAAALNGDAWVRVGKRELSPPEISAMILREIRASAEAHLGRTLEAAVISVPAYFSDAQRQAVKDAGKLAGLKVRGILNEPTAAALALGLPQDRDRRIAVFDLGGGTFDVSILQVSRGVFRVLATSGDTFLGGDDFDLAILRNLAWQFTNATGVDPTENPEARRRLKDAAQQAKIDLSTDTQVEIRLPFLCEGPDGPLNLRQTLERGELESLGRDLLDRLTGPCLQALSDARLEPSDLSDLLLVGGMSRMPAVQAKAREIFEREPRLGDDPDHIVALGAAMHSGVLSGEMTDMLLLDVTPYSMGIRVVDDRMSVLIPRNTTIPAIVTKSFSTTRDDQRNVTVRVYQGERESVNDNIPLGDFKLGNLPARPAGEVVIDVAFSIDADGILHVSAAHEETGKSASISMRPFSGLSSAQLDRIGHDLPAPVRRTRDARVER